MRIAVLMGPLSLSFRKSLDLSTCRQDPMGMSGTDYCVLRVAECLRDLGHSVVLRCVSAEAGTTWNGIEVISAGQPLDRESLHVGSGIVESPKHVLYHHNPEHTFNRYWLPGYPIMVGGSVLSADDWAHMASAYGLQRCVNVETEHSDRGKVPDDVLCEAQVHDDGSPFRPEAIGEVIDFARRFPVNERLYVHCQMGGSRSPGFSYAILRGKYGLSQAAALAVINGGFPHAPGHHYGHHPVHQSYIASVDAWLRVNHREPMTATTRQLDACIAVNEPDELRDAPAGAFRVAYMLLNDISFGRCGVSDHVDLFVSPSAPHLEQFRTNPAWHRVQVSPTHPDGAETFRFDESKWTVVPLGCDPERLWSVGACPKNPAFHDGIVSENGTHCRDCGVQLKDERGEAVVKQSGKVVYSSSPDRGLHWLLQEWPRIKAAVPHATLHIYYHLARWLRGFDTTPHYPPIEPLRYRANYIEECLRRYAAKGGMGITVHDSVSRDVIEREMASAEVLGYPCQTTTWSEGFSCTILECCAARACPVITDCDALGAVYADIDPVPMQGDWVREWSDRVIRALTDAEWREGQNEKARALSEKLTWKRTVEELCKQIETRRS